MPQQIVIKKAVWTNDFFYPAAIWLTSRMLIWIVMLVIVPLLSTPGGIATTFDWGAF
ncbi:MAG: hypothetical protein ICV78_20990, partial [Tolypothrix sp. Co-bin9]|nr:hypothetical protein [Tolypothrix sp. Co-bin9]